jgi:hypothetical protein
MGSAEDPKDGKSVATAVFGAVVIYGVSSGKPIHFLETGRPTQHMLIAHHSTGLPPLLRQPGIPTPETASRWRDRAAVEENCTIDKRKAQELARRSMHAPGLGLDDLLHRTGARKRSGTELWVAKLWRSS